MMNGLSLSRVLSMAVAMLALCTAEAAAQAPSVSVHVNGTIVTVDWSTVPGATGYEVQAGTARGAANIGTFPTPAHIRSFQVNAPPGTYYLRVRGFAPGIFGPFSDDVEIRVTGASCEPPAAPTLSANPGAGSVTLTWQNVPAAHGYRIELSRSRNSTEYAEILPATATSWSRYLGLTGTFYARLTVGTACGQATSATVEFQITSLTGGGGPRTPDPPPGQLLPVPTYGEFVVNQVAAAHRGALFNSCGNNEFMLRVVQALRTLDSRWGLNYKRGHRPDLSQDIVAYNPTNRPDEGESQIYLFDIIVGHCSGNPGPFWSDATAATWAARGNPACGTTWCAYWTLEPYRQLGITP